MNEVNCHNFMDFIINISSPVYANEIIIITDYIGDDLIVLQANLSNLTQEVKIIDLNKLQLGKFQMIFEATSYQEIVALQQELIGNSLKNQSNLQDLDLAINVLVKEF
jgi:hypothetical protein